MPKITDEPRGKRRGWLLNGNPPGDFSTAARCLAKTRRGSLCQAPAMRNGRCRLHGGPSTGPRTAEGLERSRRARWKHGFYSREAVDARAKARRTLRMLRDLAAGVVEVTYYTDDEGRRRSRWGR